MHGLSPKVSTETCSDQDPHIISEKSSGVHFFTNIIETDDGALLEARWRQPQSMDRIYGLEVMRLVQSTGIKGALISA